MSLAPTAFTELVGCRLPIQQAGMGMVSTPALAAAVARAGGLGMLAAPGMAPDRLVVDVGRAVEAAGAGARIGVNFLVPFLDLATFDAAASCAALVECFYGDPDPDLVSRAHDAGALVAWQVGSRDEAIAAAEAGCDIVVVQGTEAGGHVRGDMPLLELLGVTRTVVDVPLVAAGGIGSGRTVADALLAGADAVRIGTRFLATTEADVHPAYAGALVHAGAEDTVVTETFAMAWPDAPHRVLRSSIVASNDPPHTRSPFPPTRDFQGDVRSAALYAGTSVAAVTAVVPAADVIAEIVAEASRAQAAGRNAGNG